MKLFNVFLIAAVAVLAVGADPLETKDLAKIDCVHYTDPNDDPDMSIEFSEADSEDMVSTKVSVVTSINNDHNWFTVFDGITQVAWGENYVLVDSDDTKVSMQITLPIPKRSPKKPNGRLTFEGDREFTRFYCIQK